MGGSRRGDGGSGVRRGYAKRAGHAEAARNRPVGWESLLGGLAGVALVEAVDAALGVDQGLCAGEIRMARRTCVDGHLLLRRAGLDHVPASAGDRGVFVFWMDVTLHFFRLSGLLLRFLFEG